MHVSNFLKIASRTAILALPLITGGCADAVDRLNRLGGPELTEIKNPTETAGYEPVRMPMPVAEQVDRSPNSLWQTGSRAFFKDQRANRVGDILTVNINVADKAKMNNQTTRTRAATEDAGISNLFGLEGSLAGKAFPAGFDPSKLVGTSSASSNVGDGQIDRKEEINLRVAAVVTQVLPNGNLALKGQQELLVNKEKRELYVAGVVRPEDISSANDIRYDQIAEARIYYGGEGTLSDVQHPRYGQELADIILPF